MPTCERLGPVLAARPESFIRVDIDGYDVTRYDADGYDISAALAGRAPGSCESARADGVNVPGAGWQPDELAHNHADADADGTGAR